MSGKRKYGIESEKVDGGRIQEGFKERKFDARGNFHVLRLTDAHKRLTRLDSTSTVHILLFAHL